jgi:hypothetical protein
MIRPVASLSFLGLCACALAAAETSLMLADTELDGWSTRIEIGGVVQGIAANDLGGLSMQSGLRLGMFLSRPEWRWLDRLGATWTTTEAQVSSDQGDYSLGLDTVALEAQRILLRSDGLELTLGLGPAARRVDYVLPNGELQDWVPAFVTGLDLWLKPGRTWAISLGGDLCLATWVGNSQIENFSPSTFGLRLALAWTY